MPPKLALPYQLKIMCQAESAGHGMLEIWGQEAQGTKKQMKGENLNVKSGLSTLLDSCLTPWFFCLNCELFILSKPRAFTT